MNVFDRLDECLSKKSKPSMIHHYFNVSSESIEFATHESVTRGRTTILLGRERELEIEETLTLQSIVR